MPLALELATARLRSMSLAQLHDRLEHRFGLLTGGSRTALPRQQTLGALVDWSYDLLSESERALFRRVSVFVDGFDLESAEIVCALDDVATWEIADLLASLVDKSLVVAEPQGEVVRYRVQETLHEYGSERLATLPRIEEFAGEAEQVAASHANYYLTLAEAAEPHLLGRSPRKWLARLDTDEQNLRAAIEFALGTPEGASRVLSQFWSLQRYWNLARRPAEALLLLDRALDRVGPDITISNLAKALYCKALILRQVNIRQELSTLSTALDLARSGGDTALEADMLSVYCQSLAFNGRSGEAVEAGMDAVSLARQLDDPVLLGAVLLQYAIALYQVDDARAESTFHEALSHVEQTGDAITAVRVHNVYALLLIRHDKLADARRHLELALDLSGNEMNARSTPQYLNLGWVLLSENDAERAAPFFANVLRACRLNGALVDTAYAVLGTACCKTNLQMPEYAATLHGGADALLSVGSDQWEVLEERIRAQDISVLQDTLGDEFERCYATGRAMPHSEIIKLAVARVPLL
jgi:non-specific serine/threonine protein kinase